MAFVIDLLDLLLKIMQHTESETLLGVALKERVSKKLNTNTLRESIAGDIARLRPTTRTELKARRRSDGKTATSAQLDAS
jgi:hypothetical protein